MRYKEYTLINVLGLAVSIACCILIMFFVKSEYSYDRFHSKGDRIYRAWAKEVLQGEVYLDGVTPVPLGPAMQESFPEVESMTRVYAFNTMVKKERDKLNEIVHMVDPAFFGMFDFPLIEGNKAAPFQNVNSLVITQSLARKFFGNVSPVGKNITVELGNDPQIFTITALAKDPPAESSIRFGMLISFSNAPKIFSPNTLKSWGSVVSETYVLLKKDAAASQLEAKLPVLSKQHFREEYTNDRFVIHLQPLTAMHLDVNTPAGIAPVSNPKYAYILSSIGIMLLLIACINFVTLSIGRSTTRAMEVGIRKVLGAERKELKWQFWGEALLLTFISLITGIVISFLLLPAFNSISNKSLGFTVDWIFIAYCVGLLFVIGLLAGIYPAVVLSGFAPIQVLKGRLKAAANIGLLRKGLITGQFVASIIMIVCTFMVSRQLNFLYSKDLGYKKESTIVVPTNKTRREGNKLAALYREQLSKDPQIKGTTAALYSFNEDAWVKMDYRDNKNVTHTFQMNAIDAEFIPVMGIQMAAGRNFLPQNTSDSMDAMILNEAMAEEYGWTPQQAIGQKLPGNFEQTIVGVVKDFNFESLRKPVTPLMLVMKPDSVFRRINNISFDAAMQPRITIRMQPGNPENQVAALRKAWKAVAGDQDFEYRFLDESLATMYLEEQRLGTIVRYASGLSIFVACMGLFGLATLIITRRTKEIGIRKVLGADVSSIIRLVSKEFIIMVTVAAFISFPIAWWVLNKWLQDFAYRVNISWWVFAVSGIAALLVALFTVSFQAIKAALMNPVKSLRTE